MKTRNAYSAKQNGFMLLWNHRYLVMLIFIATYISLELFYSIREDVNSFCRKIPTRMGSDLDRQLTTIPLFTTTYTRNHYHHYHHYHKTPPQGNLKDFNYPSPLNDSQPNLKFCSDSDKCKFLFPYQPSSYKSSKSIQIQFFTYVNLAQILNLTVVLPSNEYNASVLKKLFPNVRFIGQHEFRLWMNSRIRKPSIIHEFIAIWGSKVESVEVLNKDHPDFFIHEWSEKLDFALFGKNRVKDRDGINDHERVTFKKINLGLKSLSSKKSVKRTTQFLLDELKNNDAEVLLLAHDLKFDEFTNAFSAIKDSKDYVSVEKIDEICNKGNLQKQ
ncbi:5774_t:CDS:2 [Acaulospora morrowiae]|uniref:5774_t:CDS:1 n=1 Tax=Acaulospora morrowiae TaxID=94023 RepID=A0A9N9BPX6_9GLOM|nr:5774_t:CDS:2 [Acaulospora morrowiae]